MTDIVRPLKIVPDTQLVAEFHKEYRLKARTIRPHPGMRLYAVDLSMMIATLVEVHRRTMIDVNREEIQDNRVYEDPTKIYTWAINDFNALRKVVADYRRFTSKSKG